MPTARQADATEVASVSAALTEAFDGEPVTEWMLLQRTRRRARRELMFTLDLQVYVLDTEGLPAYIEASSDGNAALYERLGFVHQGVLELPDDGPPVWPMRRPPRERSKEAALPGPVVEGPCCYEPGDADYDLHDAEDKLAVRHSNNARPGNKHDDEQDRIAASLLVRLHADFVSVAVPFKTHSHAAVRARSCR